MWFYVHDFMHNKKKIKVSKYHKKHCKKWRMILNLQNYNVFKKKKTFNNFFRVTHDFEMHSLSLEITVTWGSISDRKVSFAAPGFRKRFREFIYCNNGQEFAFDKWFLCIL